MDLRVYKILEKTKVEGPETRFCIWVQGCSIHCKGCRAKETWSFEKGMLVNVEDLYKRIIRTAGIEGVTFLGGEPFEQSDVLYQLAIKLKEHNLGILTFTGYNYEYILERKNKSWLNLLSVTDLLVDGPFKSEKFDLSRPWVGSSNQNYRFLTSRYKYIEDKLHLIKNKVELRVNSSGHVFINGMGNFNYVKEILKGI